MHDILSQLGKSTKHVTLRSVEKEQMTHALLSYMRESRMHADTVRGTLGIFVRFVALHPVPFSLLLFVALGSGASFAAQDALPGDTLYSVKTSVNEEVKGWLALSPESQLAYEKDIAERRLQEAEKLVLIGKLDDSAKEEITRRFADRAENVRMHLERLGAEDVMKESSDFEARMNAHGIMLAELSGRSGIGLMAVQTKNASSKGMETSSIVDVIRDKASTTAAIRREAEEKISVEQQDRIQALAEKRQEEAEKEIIAVNQLKKDAGVVSALPQGEESTRKEDEGGAFSIKAVAVDISIEQKEEKESLVEETAESLLAKGKEKMALHEYSAAAILFQKAQRVAQEARVLFEVKKEFKLEISIPPKEDDVGEEDLKDDTIGDEEDSSMEDTRSADKSGDK